MKKVVTDFELAVDKCIEELLDMWSKGDKEDPSFSAENGHWVADDRSGVYIYGDCWFVITLTEVIFCIKNNVSYETFITWYEYVLSSIESGKNYNNLQTFVSLKS